MKPAVEYRKAKDALVNHLLQCRQCDEAQHVHETCERGYELLVEVDREREKFLTALFEARR